MSRIGVHVKTGSRNGYGLVCEAKPAIAFAVGEGGALIDAFAKSEGYNWGIFRDIKYYGDNPNLDHMTVAEAIETAENIYPLLLAQWRLNPADYYAVLNETGANDTRVIEVANAYENRMMELAEADGFLLCICNLFSGTPDDGSVNGQPPDGGMETWKHYYGDHIARAFEGGHIYGRHCYGFPDLLPLDFNSDRPFREVDWLASQGLVGGVAITELGLNGGMTSISQEHLINQMSQYDALMRSNNTYLKYFVGGAWWTYGDWHSANIEVHSVAIADYLAAQPSERWHPPKDDGTSPIPPTKEQVLWDASVDEQETCGVRMNDQAGLFNEIVADGLFPVHSELPIGSLTIQAGEDLARVKPRAVYVYAPGQQIYSFTEPGEYVPPTIPEFSLSHWPTIDHFITQPFGVNADRYEQYGLPGHNGWDFRAPMGAPFFAPQDGQVIWASDRVMSDPSQVSDYGWHVRIDHGYGRISILAHAAPNLSVSVGQEVDGGQVVAHSGNTGNSTGPHLHYEMRKCPGLPGWPWCIINPWKYLEPLYNPPSTGGISMRPYWLPVAEGPGPFFVLQHSNGRTEDVQHQVAGSEVWVVKNRNYEHLRVNNGYIERREDTSPDPATAPGAFYLLDDGNGWSRWSPEVWQPGDSFFRNPVIHWYDDNCHEVKTEQAGTWLSFDKFYASWTSPASNASPNGITLSNVVQLSWRLGRDTSPIEQYWLAKNIGYPVQWMNSHGAHSWISELPQGRPPLNREVIHCL